MIIIFHFTFSWFHNFLLADHHILFISSSLSLAVKLRRQSLAKMDKCSFHTKNPAFCPIFQTNQKYTPILKLDFLKSSCKCITQFLEYRVMTNMDLEIFFFFFFGGSQVHGTRVPYKVLKFMELKFHLNFFHELKYFTWYSSSLNGT